MKNIDLRNLDFNNAGAWPLPLKLLFCGLLALLILFGSWWFFVSNQREELAGLERKEAELKAEFKKKQDRALNLEALKKQLAEMEIMLNLMVNQLPNKDEMANLIVEISQIALATGVTNELFQPGEEVRRDFYAEKPISLRMVGTYHQFGAFISRAAMLQRVVLVTMHDISLKPRTTVRRGEAVTADQLVLEGTIKTYRRLEAGEAIETSNAKTTATAQAAGGH